MAEKSSWFVKHPVVSWFLELDWQSGCENGGLVFCFGQEVMVWNELGSVLGSAMVSEATG
jgi:hypothetical protein